MSRFFHINRKKFLTLLATSMFVVLSMLSIGTSFALDPNGALGANPLNSVADKWVEIQPGEVHWYMVDYDPRLKNKDLDGRLQPISIWMDIAPYDYDMNFSVWAPQNLYDLDDAFGDTRDAPPLGRGSMDDNTPGDYYWTGEYFKATTFYVAVENNSNQTRYYSIGSANKRY